MVLLHQLAALLHHADAVRTQAKLNYAALPGGIEQLDDAHAADGKTVGNRLLGHIFKIIIPDGFDHQSVFVMNGVIIHKRLRLRVLKENNNRTLKQMFAQISIAPETDNVNSFKKLRLKFLV